MRIFVLGAGASGSYLAQLLARQGHQVTCGDRDPERARRFLGKKHPLPVVQANARNVRSVVRAARGCHLLVNASPAKFNESALRAALRLRAHYLDLSAHLARNPFKAEQLGYDQRFTEKRRAAVINAGIAPGLTNLLVARSAELLDQLDSVHIRLYESTDGDTPVSQWSAEGLFDEAVSRPRVFRDGRFHLAKRFSERERFRFPAPVGEVSVVLAAQDEVATLPYHIPLRQLDVKIGGNEIDRLRRWHRQGKLHRSRGLVAARFPHTSTPRQVARLIRRGKLQNARFAAAVVARGTRKDRPVEIRWDVGFPTLYQIRMRGLTVTPITYGTAQMAALFVRYFPRELRGVFAPETLPSETRRNILNAARARGFRISMKTRRGKPPLDEEW
jgi:NAD(P)-dependent dehydrogenase (short-subunit alcohol dehydrogenase family)